MKSSKHIMILAGEPSGDLHAGSLTVELKRMSPLLKVSGIGGPCMKKAGADLFYNIENLTVMGVVEVFSQIRYIKQAYDIFRRRIRTGIPDLLILVDYPGFNLRAAAIAKQLNIPVLYYIAPKVWAWKKSRLRKIKQVVDYAALIFPFEHRIYKRAGIAATFVGNPLLDYIDWSGPTVKKNGRPDMDHLVVGLLPGSRRNEIKSLLPVMLESALRLQHQFEKISFMVSAASSVDPDSFSDIMKPYLENNRFSIIHGDPQPIFAAADFLIAASGTVTLEAAIHGIPTIILYKTAPLTFFLGKHMVELKYIGLANIIIGQEIMPELLQDEATAEKIFQKAMQMLNPENLQRIQKQLSGIHRLLGKKGAASRTARIAMRMLN